MKTITEFYSSWWICNKSLFLSILVIIWFNTHSRCLIWVREIVVYNLPRFVLRLPVVYDAPPKIGKNKIFWHKIVIFHTKYPQNFAPPSAIGKNMIFWRKIVIFHTKYPKNFAPHSARRNFFKCALPSLKSWIRPCDVL